MSPNEFVSPHSPGSVGSPADHCQTPPHPEPAAVAPRGDAPPAPASPPSAEEQEPGWADDLPALARSHLPRRPRPQTRGKRLVLPAEKPEPISPQQRLLLL